MADPREHSTDMPRASRRGLLLGGLSAAALLGIAPCAQAAPAPAAPLIPVRPAGPVLTGTRLDLGMRFSGWLTVEGSYVLSQTKVRADAIAAVRNLRGEMWDINPWFHSGNTLQGTAMNIGYSTKQEYVNGLTWSNDIEEFAVYRAVWRRTNRVEDSEVGYGGTGWWGFPFKSIMINERVEYTNDSITTLLSTGQWGHG